MSSGQPADFRSRKPPPVPPSSGRPAAPPTRSAGQSARGLRTTDVDLARELGEAVRASLSHARSPDAPQQAAACAASVSRVLQRLRPSANPFLRSRLHLMLGAEQMQAGRLSQAGAALREADADLRDAVGPWSPYAALVSFNLALLHFRKGEEEEAGRRLARAKAIAERDLQSAEGMALLAAIYHALGCIRDKAADFKGAGELYAKSLKVWRHAAEALPSGFADARQRGRGAVPVTDADLAAVFLDSCREGLSRAAYSAAELCRVTGDVESSEQMHTEALELRLRLASSFPDQRAYKLDVARSRLGLALLYAHNNRQPAAKAQAQAVLEVVAGMGSKEEAQAQALLKFLSRPSAAMEKKRAEGSRLYDALSSAQASAAGARRTASVGGVEAEASSILAAISGLNTKMLSGTSSVAAAGASGRP